MASLRLPPTLRSHVGGARDVEISGDTLRTAMDDLATRHPGLRDQLLNDDGEIQRFVNVYVEGDDVRLGDGLDTPLGPSSKVIVLPAMAGGAANASIPCTVVGHDILSAIGNTPLIELARLADPAGARVWAKLEMLNPSGSVKDRVARSMIEAAERDGLIGPGSTIMEPTSGNTGIALAMIACARAYHFRAVMPESATAERAGLIRRYGAEIIYSPGELGSNGAVLLARELAAANPDVYMPFQYANPANPDAHYRTTGPEILAALDGRVDAFVAGLGTGGTLMGTGRALREANPDVRIIAAEPLQGDAVMGLRSLDDGYVPEILDVSQLDRKMLVTNEDSVRAMRALLHLEGVYAGVSAGGAVHVALLTAARMDPEQNVVVLLPDGGDRYASSGLFDRNDEELEQVLETRLWW